MRRLTLKNCQLDQAGEVSYQALNAITSAMLNVKGKKYTWYIVRIKSVSWFYHFIISCKNKGIRSVGKK